MQLKRQEDRGQWEGGVQQGSDGGVGTTTGNHTFGGTGHSLGGTDGYPAVHAGTGAPPWVPPQRRTSRKARRDSGGTTDNRVTSRFSHSKQYEYLQGGTEAEPYPPSGELGGGSSTAGYGTGGDYGNDQNHGSVPSGKGWLKHPDLQPEAVVMMAEGGSGRDYTAGVSSSTNSPGGSNIVLRRGRSAGPPPVRDGVQPDSARSGSVTGGKLHAAIEIALSMGTPTHSSEGSWEGGRGNGTASSNTGSSPLGKPPRANSKGRASSGVSKGRRPSSLQGGGGGGNGGGQIANGHATGSHALTPWEERWSMALLVLLYMMQGIPMGLTLGAMPFMLQSRLSYSQIGTFSLAAYPYSLKLLWSPIVDSLYIPWLGRRKSWIVPIQMLTAGLMFFCADWVTRLYEAASVGPLTALFFVFVFLAATQDIAVDGWALTLLSPPNVGYASTCQTIGTSTGFFTSFTVFLALQDVRFCNAYIRSSWLWSHLLGLPSHLDEPLVTLPGYLRFWGLFFALVTFGIWALKPEVEGYSEEELRTKERAHALLHPEEIEKGAPGSFTGGWRTSALTDVLDAYWALWRVVRLRAVWGLSALLLTYRLGVLAAEGAFSLKLIDKGVSKEGLAFMVLLQFPMELFSAVLAGRWAAAHTPYPPFITAYFTRLVVVAVCVLLVYWLPPGLDLPSWAGPAAPWTAAVVGLNLGSALVTTVCFTSLGSFFNQISDPAMGGAYLTLLNTIANMGIIIPKAPAFYLMDALTRSACLAPPHGSHGTAAHAILNSTLSDAAPAAAPGLASAAKSAAAALTTQVIVPGLSCPRKARDLGNPSPCTAAGGTCVITADGFYSVSLASLVLGAVLGLAYARHLPALMRLPLDAWRALPSTYAGAGSNGFYAGSEIGNTGGSSSSSAALKPPTGKGSSRGRTGAPGRASKARGE